MVFIILFVFVATLLYYLIQKNNSYWSKNGVPGPKPMPIVGNFGKGFIGKLSFGDIITNAYREYEGYPFVGLYKATKPLFVPRDPELLKNIFLKDFKHFHDNDITIHRDLDPIFSRNPFCMKGTEWKNKRAQLTQCFTSGKIKGMYGYLEHNSKRMVKYIDDNSKNSTPLEAREVCMRFTLDNVAICAFGVDGKAFEDEKSSFRELAEKFLSPDNWNKFKIFLSFSFPAVNNFIRLKFVCDEVNNRLFALVRKTIKHRKENNITRNDFLDGCTNLSTENGLFTEVDIVAHAASFFGDGYETSSRVMSFLLFELALNPDVQQKLREEINASYEKNGNKFTYESVHDMAYLEACLKENLRKNSIVHFLGKVCTEDYEYTSTTPDYKNLSVKLKVGDSIAIPITGIHKDPKYFEEPDNFVPERFLNKEPMNKFVYLAWGEGPRFCIGQRFATTQIKVGVVHVIKNFCLTVNSKTRMPLEYDPFYIMLHAVGGLWVDFKKVE